VYIFRIDPHYFGILHPSNRNIRGLRVYGLNFFF
jgi:hypothetical protein